MSPRQDGALPGETPVATEGVIEVYTDAANAEALKKAGADGGINGWLKAHLLACIAAIMRPALFFLRSPRMRPPIWRFQGMASFGVIKAAQARGDFDMLTIDRKNLMIKVPATEDSSPPSPC